MISPSEQKPPLQAGVRAIVLALKPYRRQILVLSGLGLISAIANGTVPYITGKFFNALISLSNGVNTDFHGFALWAALLSLWGLVQFVANNIDWMSDRLRRSVGLRAQLGIQVGGFAHLFELPIDFHKNERINGILQRFSQAGWQTEIIFQNIVSLAPQFLSVIIGVALAATINKELAAVLLIGVCLYCLLLFRVLKPIAKADDLARRTWNEAWDDAAAAVNHIESVKQAAAESHEISKTEYSHLKKTYSLWYGMELHWSNLNFFQRMIVFVTQLTVFVLSVAMVADNSLSIGSLIALNGYAAMFFGPFVQLGYSWQTFQNGLTTNAHAREVLDQPVENYHPKNAEIPSSRDGRVAFENVSFGYADGNQVLDSISFEVRSGQSIALVGQTGVGKSTLISLISAFYFPTAGKVLIDGVDTRRFDLSQLRSGIAVVPQEVALFNDTIEANIRYGSFKASHQEVEHAAREAHIDEFIETLPNKYQTIVGERGIKLSVGQKQRVAIARAILRNPEILILDEPTSALDSVTERQVTESLSKLMKGRTTFIIAHRLSTVRHADAILVLEDGQIVERGNHTELIKINNGHYRRLYEYQIGLHE